MCKPCAIKLRPVTRKKPPEEIRINQGAYKSYTRAKRRVEINHMGAYGHVEFRFKSYEEFLKELGPRPEGMTLDRIDPNGHYEPGNVRWASVEEQSKNRRNNIFVNYNGERMCLTDACRLSGKDRGTIKRRLEKGVCDSLLFSDGRIDSPPKTRSNAVTVVFNGEAMCLQEAARKSGISVGTLSKRLKRGVPESLLFSHNRITTKW